jgi:integrase
MAVDDLWYLKKRDPNNEKKYLPSKRHGRGKRWRVRYIDASGEGRDRLFELKRDAQDFDLKCRSGIAEEVKVDQGERRVTFADYAERWRLSRESGWTLETRKRIPGNLRNHLNPAFGKKSMVSITLTDVLEWLSRCLEEGTPKSSLKLYFGLLKTVMNAARIDRVIPYNPCDGVKLAQVLRGVSLVPKWVPTEEQVLALVDAVPDRYRAAIWLGAGQGMRLGEVFGMEAGTRCADFLRRELNVVQQLRRLRGDGTFVLTRPKAGSVGTVELDPMVADELAAHMRDFPPVNIELSDETDGEPVTRTACLLFTTKAGQPLNDSRWSEWWATWREAAGWPKEGTFHSLRHFFATTLLSNGVDPQAVQKALRHANLRVTLETYVHWLPKKDRPRGVIGSVLARADEARRALPRTAQDQS